jgi:Sugar-transfer associated ATP-grasp
MSKVITMTKGDWIIKLLNDPDRKSLLRIIYECFYLLLVYRELPVHYFSRYLFKKSTTNIRNYLPNNFLGEKVTPFFNDKKAKEVLDNKLFFDLFYKQFAISLPRILMYNSRRTFVIGSRSFVVNTIYDIISLIEEIFKENPSYDSILIKKTSYSSSGDNIYKVFRDQFKTNPESLTEIYSEVIKSEYLFQETIRQHPDLNKLNSSCVNTMRMDTFIDSDGKPDIISGFIRMSITNEYVDNLNRGGCLVSIDLQTGKLKKFGYSIFKTSDAKILTEHPITKTVFENFTIPYFTQAKELVLKTASNTPGLRLVGWDVAVGESGPIIIEGNSDYEIRGSDFANGGYLANNTFRKVLHEINFL